MNDLSHPPQGAVASLHWTQFVSLTPLTKQGLLYTPKPYRSAGNDTQVGVTKKGDGCVCYFYSHCPGFSVFPLDIFLILECERTSRVEELRAQLQSQTVQLQITHWLTEATQSPDAALSSSGSDAHSTTHLKG